MSESNPPKQSGVHVDVGNYRIVVIDDPDKPDVLSRATSRTKASVHRDGCGFNAMDLIARKDFIVLCEYKVKGEDTNDGVYIDVDVLEALLKVAGWKVQRP